MSTAPAHRSHADIVEQAGKAARGVPSVADVTVLVRSCRSIPHSSVGISVPPRVSSAGPDSAKSRAPADRPLAQVEGGPWVPPATAPATLTDVLVRAAEAEGDRGTTYVLADDNEDQQTYRDLFADAARTLPGLRENELAPGDPVLLHCDSNHNFVTGFWACLLGGFIPTPIGMARTYRWENAITHQSRSARELLKRPPLLTDATLLPKVVEMWTPGHE